MLKAIGHDGKPFVNLYRQLIDKDEEEGKIDLLMQEMMRDGLIKYEDNYGVPREWGFVKLDVKGLKVNEAGGWLKVKYETMSDEEKVHRLLGYILDKDPNKFGWTASELMEAFENSMNEFEIKYICQILIDNEDATDLTTKDGFEIGMIDKSKAAYYGKKYIKARQSPPHTVNIGTIQQVVGSNVKGGINQSADKVEKNITTAPVTITNKSETSIMEKVIKYVLAPIIVLVLGGIVLYNCFGIAP